jgi:hypothetical protein
MVGRWMAGAELRERFAALAMTKPTNLRGVLSLSL